ncbi:hypothetical protein Cgig2_033023 [Carnegiea gigantea]|uniref:Chromatin modification-related protein MEAF6 n=1 Tax=Carnegiea gigantea TaxID=171969 RepID=A0A9Q1K819_9CARY|nr:hypothetical protein Cgig2_033023 [Carnegiea gigantea]
MDSEGHRNPSNPAAVLASLLSKRAKLHEELRSIEKQVFDMETTYLQDPSQCGNVLKGYDGFLSTSKSTTLYSRETLKIRRLAEKMGDWNLVQVDTGVSLCSAVDITSTMPCLCSPLINLSKITGENQRKGEARGKEKESDMLIKILTMMTMPSCSGFIVPRIDQSHHLGVDQIT